MHFGVSWLKGSTVSPFRNHIFLHSIPLLSLFHPTGNKGQQMHQQLTKLVQGTAVGETLLLVSKVDCEEMYQRYLHDFVRMVRKCSHKGQEIVSKEYKVRLRFFSP